jgi:DNA (cytosine-5)-methyltransferase 1
MSSLSPLLPSLKDIPGKRPYSVVSLFAGAGGMDLGFEFEGFHTLWANDFDKDACATHQLWSKTEVICGDIKKVDFAIVPTADVILGGFPCQGFSLAGPRKVDDSRNTLYHYFVQLVEEKQPKMFVAENVKGLLTLGQGTILPAIVQDFADKGYQVQYKLLNANDYDVPQDRSRVILIGTRNDLVGAIPFDYPEPAKEKLVIKDVLTNDLANPPLEEICIEPYSSRYMSRNRRRGWDEPSFTIPAMAKQVALHPSSTKMVKLDKDLWKFGSEGETRRLSWKEASIIQTFPADLVFEGNLTSKYKQIGNAVPVNLARHIAKEIKTGLDAGLKT